MKEKFKRMEWVWIGEVRPGVDPSEVFGDIEHRPYNDCPNCKSGDYGHSLHKHDDELEERFDCNDCGAEWYNYYSY